MSKLDPPLDLAVALFHTRLLANHIITAAGCWVRPTASPVGKYIQIHARPYKIHAHRLAVFATSGVMPEVAMHHCDNPHCFRPHPEHVVGSTQKENLADMTRKGRRMFAGDRRWMVKNGVVIRVQKQDVAALLADGWKIGRIKR